MSSKGSWNAGYKKQLQACNAVHVLSGLISFCMAATQFFDISLENYNHIDFRLLNWIHLMTGAVGVSVVFKNYGSIAAKSLYIISSVLGLFTAAFYCTTIVQAVKRYQEIVSYSNLAGGQDDGYVTDRKNHTGKIAVCAIMIGIGVVEFVAGIISVRFLEKLAGDGPKIRPAKSGGRLAFVAGMKLFFAAATVVLGGYLEHFYYKQSNYVKIGWHILAGGIVVCSGFVDLVVVNRNRRHSLLNLKVSLVMSIVAAVFCLKTLDFMTSGFFLADVSEYISFRDPKVDSTEDIFDSLLLVGSSTTSGYLKRQLFIKFCVHASVIGCLVLLFIQCVISAVEAGSCMEKSRTCEYGTAVQGVANIGTTAYGVENKLHARRNCLGVLQFLLGIFLIALCVVSLVPWDFAEGYTNGPGVLWVGCLFLASGSASSSRIKTLTTVVYTLEIISSVVALEYFLFSLNSIYQASTHESFQDQLQNMRTGRIALYSIQAGILLAEFLSATAVVAIFGKEISQLPSSNLCTSSEHPKIGRRFSCLSFFHFVYAIFTIGVSVVSEVGIWRFNASPIHNSYVKLTNGPIILATGIVQIVCGQKFGFLLPSSILQIVCAAIALFILAPATTNLYYLVTMYQVQYDSEIQDIAPLTNSESDQKFFAEIAIYLTSALIFLSMIEYVVSIVSAMYHSYLMHHYFSGVRTDGGRFSTIRSHLVPYFSGDSSQFNADLQMNTNDNAVVLKNGDISHRYFGNDYRTYGELNHMYNPDDVVFKTDQSNQYGYVQQRQNKTDNYAQTNVRHVFHSLHNGYLTAYT